MLRTGLKISPQGRNDRNAEVDFEEKMRVLGIDPGSRVCGYGVLETRNGELFHTESGCITPPAALPLPIRLKLIYEGLCEVITRSCPDAVCIEGVFFAKNAKSALKLGEARGIAILAAASSNIPIHEYSPTQIKLAVTGKGRAGKLQVQTIISRILGIPEWKRHDVSDAVAVAICHINFSRSVEKLGVAVTGNRRRRRRWTENDIASKRQSS